MSVQYSTKLPVAFDNCWQGVTWPEPSPHAIILLSSAHEAGVCPYAADTTALLTGLLDMPAWVPEIHALTCNMPVTAFKDNE